MAALTRVDGRSERGQAIIELALTLPLLLLIILGVFDFGLMFQRYEVVTNAAREGARLAILKSQGYSTDDAKQRALDYLAYGGVSGGVRTGPCSTVDTTNPICVSVTESTTPIAGSSPVVNVDEMVVTVEYDHSHLFVGPIMGLFGSTFTSTPLRSTSRMRVE